MVSNSGLSPIRVLGSYPYRILPAKCRNIIKTILGFCKS